MKITREIVRKLNDYKIEHGISAMELAHRLDTSRAHMGRILHGEVHYVLDDLSNNIRTLLGLADTMEVVEVSRDVIEVRYVGKAMEPILESGKAVSAESVILTHINEGDIVICRFRDAKGERTVVRYFRRLSNIIELSAENARYKKIQVKLSEVVWIARVLRPIRSVRAGD